MIYRNIEITSREVLGPLLFFGPLQFMLAIVIGEGMLPNYHPGIHYVSTLGVGETAVLFNGSVILLGLCMTHTIILPKVVTKNNEGKKIAGMRTAMTDRKHDLTNVWKQVESPFIIHFVHESHFT
ncbi:MAG: hypothetical protein KAT16_01310 [Candidatus Heimdallarchaeota archaeon]|nr:hypothetical protein [Candidatus Heimdallarchaeota archaeon]